MKRNMCTLFFSIVFFILSSCSFPNRIPSSGTWHNEELNISFECTTNRDNRAEITNIVWNSKGSKNIDLNVHLGYGSEILFYYTDENDNEVDILVGEYEYSDDRFIVTAWQLAIPFDISGTLINVSDKVFVFDKGALDSKTS